jgi:hypothetical protein
MELKHEAEKRQRRQSMKRKGTAGLVTGLAVLLAFEVGGRLLAEGYPEAEWRPAAFALSAAAAAVGAFLRNGGSLVVLLAAGLSSQGCATTYRGAMGGTAFAPGYTPEQCLKLREELRTYTATGEGLLYLAGAGAVVTGIALALTSEKAAPAVGAGVSLLATGGARFTASQEKSLTKELALGGCPR